MRHDLVGVATMPRLLGSFTLTVPEAVTLQDTGKGLYLATAAPLRVLRLSKPLYELLRRIGPGSDVSDLWRQDAPPALVAVLLSLAAKGYLGLSCDHTRLGPDHLPPVTIVIPVRNRPQEIRECLSSLASLDYPPDRVETIVVDDGSTDDTADVIKGFGVKCITLGAARGQSSCRNVGSREAAGDIIAFLDSDCTATPAWLREMVPFFAFPGIGAVGGRVVNYHKTSPLARYEEVFSPLNLGGRILFDANPDGAFYVPSCNLLVRKDVFRDAGGFNEDMQVGEDVDLCWRMRDTACHVLYFPAGAVMHKHRNTLPQMLARRAAYGTSEAGLYLRHAARKKQFPVPVWAGLSFVLVFLAAVLQQPLILFLILPVLGGECWEKWTASMGVLNEIYGKRAAAGLLFRSVGRSTVSFYYFASYFLTRYFLVPILLLGLVFPPLLLFGVMLIFASSVVDYRVKKPRLSYPSFLFYYLLDHLAYQFGVFQGCLKYKYFKCYVPRIKIRSLGGLRPAGEKFRSSDPKAVARGG